MKRLGRLRPVGPGYGVRVNETESESESTGDFGSADLVEPEGVNAASREVADEHPSGGGDVTWGGAPERAREQMAEPHPPEEMVGTSGDQDGGPGQQLSAGEG